MYDKSKAVMLEYLKLKDDEIKELNSRIDLLKESNDFHYGLLKNLSDECSNVFWDSKDLENRLKNLRMDYSRMERKVKANSVMVYIQPFVWSACWFFMQWLLKG